jgi:hypothetical protein
MRKSSDPPLEKGCCDKTLLESASRFRNVFGLVAESAGFASGQQVTFISGARFRDNLLQFCTQPIVHRGYSLMKKRRCRYSTLDLEHQTAKPLFQAQPEAQNAFPHRIACFIISSMGTYSSALQRSKQQPL